MGNAGTKNEGTSGKGPNAWAQLFLDGPGFMINKINDKIDNPILNGLTNFIQSPVDNMDNWANGNEDLGRSDNPFGSGWIGDFLNPMVGGRTDQQREDDKQNQIAWNNYLYGENKPDSSVKLESSSPNPNPRVAPSTEWAPPKKYNSVLDDSILS